MAFAATRNAGMPSRGAWQKELGINYHEVLVLDTYRP
jgi:hypothetical protein